MFKFRKFHREICIAKSIRSQLKACQISYDKLDSTCMQFEMKAAAGSPSQAALEDEARKMAKLLESVSSTMKTSKKSLIEADNFIKELKSGKKETLKLEMPICMLEMSNSHYHFHY